MSQRAQILRDLKRGKSITPMNALKEYGCFRLAARIAELRQQGAPIRTTMIEGPNGRIWAEYRI